MSSNETSRSPQKPSYSFDSSQELIATLQNRIDRLLVEREALTQEVLASAGSTLGALNPDNLRDRVIVSNRDGSGPFPLVYNGEGWIAQWGKNTTPYPESLPWSLGFWMNDWTINFAN